MALTVLLPQATQSSQCFCSLCSALSIYVDSNSNVYIPASTEATEVLKEYLEWVKDQYVKTIEPTEDEIVAARMAQEQAVRESGIGVKQNARMQSMAPVLLRRTLPAQMRLCLKEHAKKLRSWYKTRDEGREAYLARAKTGDHPYTNDNICNRWDDRIAEKFPSQEYFDR